eukprot:TRINITY_DN115752_c0_g1_i1.p1 TRINITY_DN115752_c0_g1~~TRINITY_DN115752_c0_g1_i1.p1  ORF type:complete len:221 (-),score=59.46 TRINITY_DN115752_c0_g1_i1:104-766(-)
MASRLVLSLLLAGNVADATVLLRGHRAGFEVTNASMAVGANTTASETGKVHLAAQLQHMADQCQCHFRGLCTCGAAVEFMDCIADSCASGMCDCKSADFLHACDSMSQTCPTTGLTCSEEKATCQHTALPDTWTEAEIREDLAILHKRKCVLQDAAEVGYVNAGIRLKQVKIVIQGHLDLLKAKGAKEAPYMGCGPKPKGQYGKDWQSSWTQGEAVPVKL